MESTEPAVASLGGEDTRKAAFEQLMRAYERPVLRLCLRMLRNPEDAQDAAQDAFLKIYRKMETLEKERSAAPWVYQIAANVCRDKLRARRPAEPLDSIDAWSRGALPDAAAEREQERKMIADGLERLPEKERAALVLRDMEGLSTSDVARILGSSEGTVRSQISTARVKLKRFAESWRRKP
jgi:RNA polymerase sigma-70 factor, ECF subfamily